MGAARVYVIIAAAVLVLLAALGIVHIFSRGGDVNPTAVQSGPTPAQVSPQPTRAPAADQELARAPLLAITDLKPTRQRLRDGATRVAVRIGVTPRPEAEKGEVEIRVFFFDITRDGELRPTEAEVTYEWLTPFRDWSDPTPKYLEATCVRPRRVRGAGERLRYGGFIVRVYSDGKLQDERAEPEQILAALREPAASSPATAETTRPVSPRASSSADEEDGYDDEEESASTQFPRGQTPESTVAAVPPAQTPTPASTTSTAPYGKPAPGKPGFVYSPHDEKFIIDVRGVPPGTEITDPNTGKPLRVP